MCTGNTIKKTIGNLGKCNIDSPCDGVTMVPNENHTDCGKYIQMKYIQKNSNEENCYLIHCQNKR